MGVKLICIAFFFVALQSDTNIMIALGFRI